MVHVRPCANPKLAPLNFFSEPCPLKLDAASTNYSRRRRHWPFARLSVPEEPHQQGTGFRFASSHLRSSRYILSRPLRPLSLLQADSCSFGHQDLAAVFLSSKFELIPALTSVCRIFTIRWEQLLNKSSTASSQPIYFGSERHANFDSACLHAICQPLPGPKSKRIVPSHHAM